MKTILLFTPILAVLLASCEEPATSIKVIEQSFLPSNAKVVKQLDNGWFVFEIEGKKFIYRTRGYPTNDLIAPIE